jgi:putative DNA primase/helicase
VYVAEGFATAATLHLATHKPVLAAFSTHNLEPVAKALRRQRHGVRIIVAADNDRFTQGNPGITAGRMAARAVGADLIFPEFPPGVPGTDFNDLNLAGCFR